ncbi:MAG: DNA repair protein RecO [Fimbriimonadaceae bacterium]|nr:DNA repair protein RecO [Fimbriimonadaceae bacterium]
MPEETLHAVVLRRRDSGENDRSLTLMTLEQGKIEATAKGARKAGSRLGAASEPLAHVCAQVSVGPKRRYVSQVKPLGSFSAVRGDYQRLHGALALCELYAAVLPFDQPDPEAYDLLLLSLRALADHPRPTVAAIWAEVRLLETAGFAPQFDRCAQSSGPIGENPAWFSPQAGGYVSAELAAGCADRFLVSAETLLGLARIGDLEEPPANLKRSDEALVLLHRYWVSVAGMRLAAHEAFLQVLSEP